MEVSDDDEEGIGSLRLTYDVRTGRLIHLTSDLKDGSHFLEAALDPTNGRETLVERRGQELMIKASPYLNGTDEAELAAGELLREHLNRSAGAAVWSEVSKTDETVSPDVDVEIVGSSESRIRVQVVTADRRQERWSKAAKAESDEFLVEDSLTIGSAADRLLSAIAFKEGKYPKEVKSRLTLLLDARAVPEANDTDVRRLVYERFSSTDYQAIFVTGARSGQTWKIA